MFGVNYATVIDPILRDVRICLPEFAGMQAGDSILDVCCGSGAQVYEYIRKGLCAHGVDNSQQMLDLAQRYYEKFDMTSASFILADAAHLPFVEGSFDFTSISLALHDKDAAMIDMILAEMKRVTRRGGGLVFMDYSVPLPSNLTGYLIRAIEFLAGEEHSRNFRHYLQKGGLSPIFAHTGLRLVKAERVKSGNITLMLAHDSPHTHPFAAR